MNIKTIDQISDFDEIFASKIFLDAKTHDFEKETQQNMWCIALGDKALSWLKKEEILTFLDRVLKKRMDEVKRYSVKTATFYLWVDEQAVQLRFNIISRGINQLPFREPILLLQDPEKIVDTFLASLYHAGIPYDQFVSEQIDLGKIQIDEEKPLNVFAIDLIPTIRFF